MPANRQSPTSSQIRRPQRSDSAPISGFSSMPVTVETATMVPTAIWLAPMAAANSGSTGVLPIW